MGVKSLVGTKKISSLFSNLNENVYNRIVHGKFTTLGLIYLLYFFVFMLLFTIWKGYFPSEFDVFNSLWIMAVTGLISHEVMVRARGIKPKLEGIKTKISESRNTITFIGFGYFVVVIFQTLTILLIRGARSPTMQSIPSLIGSIGAGVAEEYVFPWFLFSVFLLITKGKLGVCLFADALLFTLYHSAVGFKLYMSDPAFLPAIFVSRVIMDYIYFLSGGDLGVVQSIHLLVNGSRVFIGGG